MTNPAYPAARLVAPKVRAHFERIAAATPDAARRSAMPDEAIVEAMVDAAFWTSLRREESYVPRVSLALVPPYDTVDPLIFERPLPLAPTVLARVAPAVERPSLHLGVWPHEGELRVWGTAQDIPIFCLVLEVAAPGLLVVKHHRGGIGKFVNVAVLEGDQIKVIDETASALPDCPDLLASLLGFDSPASWIGGVNVLVQLAVSMRAHRRGGTLLVVPAGTATWRESIVHPIAYAVTPVFARLADLAERRPSEAEERLWRDALEEAIGAVGGLTAVDGATLISDRFELLAFGAKIGRREGLPTVDRVAVTEPIEGSSPAVVHPTELGGTRHLSAAQFVHDQRNALALVASQDGRFTVFAWSPCEERVHAHRVETLLL